MYKMHKIFIVKLSDCLWGVFQVKIVFINQNVQRAENKFFPIRFFIEPLQLYNLFSIKFTDKIKGTQTIFARLFTYFLYVFYLPVNRGFAKINKDFIGFGKMITSEKASVRRQRTGVRCLQYEMSASVNNFCFSSGV